MTAVVTPIISPFTKPRMSIIIAASLNRMPKPFKFTPLTELDIVEKMTPNTIA